jgi:hypothetical protein
VKLPTRPWLLWLWRWLGYRSLWSSGQFVKTNAQGLNRFFHPLQILENSVQFLTIRVSHNAADYTPFPRANSFVS